MNGFTCYLAISCCNKFSLFLFENQVKMCVAINLADPVMTVLTSSLKIKWVNYLKYLTLIR